MSCNICGEELLFCPKYDCDVCEDCAAKIVNSETWCLTCDEKEECSLYEMYE